MPEKRNGSGLPLKYRTIVADPPWHYPDGPTQRQRDRGEDSFLPYRTMANDEIEVTIRDTDSAIDAHLYLWTTQRFLFQARALATRAGFIAGPTLVWCKRPNGRGMGGAFAPTVEFCLFCRRNWGAALDWHRDSHGLTVADVHRAVRGDTPPTGLVSMWMKGERYPSDRDWERLYTLFGDLGPRAGLPKPCDSQWWLWPRGEHSSKPDAFYDLVEQVSPSPYLEMWSRRARLGWQTWGDEALHGTEALAS